MAEQRAGYREIRLRCPLCQWVSTSAPRHKRQYLTVEYQEHVSVHHTPAPVDEWADD